LGGACPPQPRPEELTKTFALVRQGELEEYKTQLIAHAVRYLDEDETETVETMVLPLAAEQTPGQLKAALAKAVMAAGPEGAELRRQEKQAQRRVCSQPTGDGEAVLSIYHSPDPETGVVVDVTAPATDRQRCWRSSSSWTPGTAATTARRPSPDGESTSCNPVPAMEKPTRIRPPGPPQPVTIPTVDPPPF
jgi:Domain of unknown function (DUF222)